MYIDSGVAAQCCGCGACADICPHNAISFADGADKAKYPVVDQEKCIHCDACKRVCPMQSRPKENNDTANAYAAVLNDEANRSLSASGGAFEGIAAALAKKHPDLLVAGAAWQPDLCVAHELLSAEMRGKFRKSKYVQSDCVGIYKKVRSALRNGKPVLFSGTPCQVAALKLFLNKDYDELYTVDLVCHGVAGASIFKSYANEIRGKQKSEIASVEFRHKNKNIYGEISSSNLKIVLANGKIICNNNKTDPYLRGFRTGLFYRESCYGCPYANPKRYSDLTLGDYWSVQGVLPQYRDDAGVSCILANSPKGELILHQAEQLDITQTDFQYLIDHNAQLKMPATMHKNRQQLLGKVGMMAFSDLIAECVGPPQHIKDAISRLMPVAMRSKINKLLKR